MLKNWDLLDRLLPVLSSLPLARLLLVGPPGIGKTFTAQQQSGTISITITPETPASEIRGHYIVRHQEMMWHDGPAVVAYRTGRRLVINEIDKASYDCLTFLLALLDDGPSNKLFLPSGEELVPHQQFHVIATTNQQPSEMMEALISRFPLQLTFDCPHPNAIRQFPETWQPGIIQSLKQGSTKDLRQWFAFVQLEQFLSRHEAAQCIFGDRAEEFVNALLLAEASVTVEDDIEDEEDE